jgi:hypothetical protein
MRFVLRMCFLGACLAFVASAAAGCGGGAAKAKVSGKVVVQGQPVAGGSLTFSPLGEGNESAAKPAVAEIQSDGTFVVATDRTADGAAIGRHQVLFSAPSSNVQWDGYGEPPPGLTSPYLGLVPKEPQVEVKTGQNELTIELVNPAAAFGS